MPRHELTLLTVAAISIGISFWALSFNTDRSSSLALANLTQVQVLEEPTVECATNLSGPCAYLDKKRGVNMRGACTPQGTCIPKEFQNSVTKRWLPIRLLELRAQNKTSPIVQTSFSTQPTPSNTSCSYLSSFFGLCSAEPTPSTNTSTETNTSASVANGGTQTAPTTPTGPTVKLSNGQDTPSPTNNLETPNGIVAQTTFTNTTDTNPTTAQTCAEMGAVDYMLKCSFLARVAHSLVDVAALSENIASGK
jgi:hypothetical protein